VIRTFILRALCVLLLALGLAQTAPAAITMTLDTELQTLVFSGSDTGTPFLIPEQAFIGWRSPAYTGSPQGFEFKAFSSSVSTLEETRTIIFIPMEGSLISILIPNPTDLPTGPVTVFADPSQVFAYGTVMSAAQASAFESAVQNYAAFPLISGTGFSPLNTQVIPEPGTVALFGVAAALVMMNRGRRVGRQGRE
jgi:hypothetical protein